jgi:hypothetical protein
MVGPEKKSIIQILEERHILKIEEQTRKAQEVVNRRRIQEEQSALENSKLFKIIERLRNEKTELFVRKWGLRPIITDIQEYFGDKTQISLDKITSQNYDVLSTSINYSNVDTNKKILALLSSKDTKEFAITLSLEISNDYWQQSGKMISFIETDNGDLLIRPGKPKDWSLESCPLIHKRFGLFSNKPLDQIQREIHNATINIFERKMENWSYHPPEPPPV